MKILIHSMVFSPSIGGTETATRLLAAGLSKLGHEVKVITDTPGTSPSGNGFDVYRNISTGEYLSLVKWSEVVVHSNISLRNVWPLLIYRRPWIIIHHSRLGSPEGHSSMTSLIKQWVTRFATNLAVSRFMADNLRCPSIVVKNPYADDVFRVQPDAVRDKDLIAVGRFMDDKGFQVVLDALARLRKRGFVKTRLTIVGDGPYREQLDAMTRQEGIESVVEFTGIKPPEELARIFNRHKILIVPSLIPETFGLVAVEGMACGCFVLASDVGSLKETIGPCGCTFKAGDSEALAEFLEDYIEHPEHKESYLKAAVSHLAQFERARVILAIAACIEEARAKWKQA